MNIPDNDLSKMKQVPPEPIEVGELPEPKDEPKKVFGVPLFPITKRTVVMGLRTVQKYSTIPMVAYFPLHAINTMLVPAISVDSAPNDVLVMIRELLPSFTTKLLVTSFILHLGSGIVLRLWQNWTKFTTRKRRHHRHHKEKQLKVTDAAERDSQRLIGLTGGLSGYFVGFNKRFTVSPQVLSGYILAPVLAYHLAIMKFIPDSSKFYIDVDFNFVKWTLQNDDWRIKWVAGLAPLSLLIYSGTYHIIAGICQYLRVRDLTKRRKWSNFILALTLSGLVAVYRLSKWTPSLAGSNHYSKVFQRLHLI